MISLPGIVLIDDNKNDLDSIQNSFVQNGYPCFPIHYINNDPNNETGIDHVNVEKIKPRIVITDLNLQEQSQFTKQTLVAPIAKVLEKFALDGPYVLYFWSKNSELVEDVVNQIFERFKYVPLPLYCGVLDKAKFKDQPIDLKNAINNILLENTVFNALFTWENRVSSAAQTTTNSLFKLAKPKNRNSIIEFQKEIKERIGIILSAIGNETLGVKNAKDDPGLAIELGLEPVLRDHIQSSYESNDNNILWKSAAPKIGNKLDQNSYSDFKSYLNSFYHIEELNYGFQKDRRGSWISFNNEYLSDSNNDLRIKNNLGRSIKTILNEEFLNSRLGNQETRKKVHSDTRLGFIELSAECDQAQRKTKLNRYFLSVLIPVEHEAYTLHGAENRRVAHSGIYRLPNIILDGNEYIIKISFMYQVGAIPTFNKWLGEPVFRLKDQILSDISFRASQHLTRPGIIRFD